MTYGLVKRNGSVIDDSSMRPDWRWRRRWYSKVAQIGSIPNGSGLDIRLGMHSVSIPTAEIGTYITRSIVDMAVM